MISTLRLAQIIKTHTKCKYHEAVDAANDISIAIDVAEHIKGRDARKEKYFKNKSHKT